MSLTERRPFISSSRFVSTEALSEHELTKSPHLASRSFCKGSNALLCRTINWLGAFCFLLFTKN